MIAKLTAAGVAAALLLLGVLPAAANEVSGEELFYANCATCHVGSSALMGMRPPPNLFRDTLGVGDSDEALTVVIHSGAGNGRMPPFRDGLDDTETRALVAFIRSQRQR